VESKAPDFPTHPDAQLKPEDAARFLGVSTRWLAEQRYKKTGPPFIRLGWRTVRYRLADLVAWAGRRRKGAATSTSPAAA
jgi:predicted DNA-binding transcriptional regulator AlpA